MGVRENKIIMQELDKKEVYSLEGLSEEQRKKLSNKSHIHIEDLRNYDYIYYGTCWWCYGNGSRKITAKAIDLFNNEIKREVMKELDKNEIYYVGDLTANQLEELTTKYNVSKDGLDDNCIGFSKTYHEWWYVGKIEDFTNPRAIINATTLFKQEIKKGQVWEHVKTGERVEIDKLEDGYVYLNIGRTANYHSFLMFWELVEERKFTSTYSGNIDLEPLKIKPLFGITSDKVVQSVMNDLNERSRVGVEKYGVTLEREDVDLIGWLKHLREELMDATLYIKRAEIELKKKYGRDI